MTTGIATFSIRLDTRRPAYRSISRRTLAEVCRPRHTAQAAWVNCYLLAPLPDPQDVSEEAIDLIKYLVGCACHFQPHAVRRIVASDISARRLMLETEGSTLTIRHVPDDVPNLMTRPRLEQDPWESLQRPARVLLEYIPSGDGNTQIAVDAFGRATQKLALAYVGTLPRGGKERFAHNAALQTEILEHSVSAAEAMHRSRASASDVSSWASRRRRDGRLFGVWLSAARAFVYPDFQFSVEGIHPRLSELLDVLRTRAGFGLDRGGWMRACWLYLRDPRLSEGVDAVNASTREGNATVVPVLGAVSTSGRAPAEVLAHEPERVVALARALP